MQRVIGIDFGTSTTYMNVKRYNGSNPAEDQFSYMPVMFNYGESNGYVASIVRENADGTFDFGEKAMEELEGSTIFTEVKMRLESPDAAEREEARRITRAFFKFLYDTYTQQSANLGSPDDTEETIVSYPVKWREETARFMLDAAREAGFQNVQGMDEATAAVSTVACQNSGSGLLCANKPGYLLLIDMGAGTTDLVVCKYLAPSGGGISVELVTSWPQDSGEPTFGGREIDGALERYIEDYLTASLNPALAPMAHNFATIPGQAKKWKELNVSVSLAADKPVTACGYIAAYGPMLKDKFSAFDRRGFEALIEGGLKDYARLIDGCLKKTAEIDGDFAATGLDLVILTGGHSAWYFAREIVDGTMEGRLEHGALEAVRREKHRVVSLPNPQTTVSLGLVYSKLPFRLAKQEPEKKAGKQAEKATEKKAELKEPNEDAEELYLQGKRYEEGSGVGQDYKKAAELYIRAAEQGSLDAQLRLAYLYETGRGVPKDWEKRAEWYRRAAEQQAPRAQCELGLCYEHGTGVEKDLVKAFFWYQKSALHDNPIGQVNLGRCYEQGIGVQKDAEQAVQWYRKAMEHGSAEARDRLDKITKEEETMWKEQPSFTGGPSVPPGSCLLTVRRQMLPIGKFYMEVDSGELYELKPGAVVQVPVKPGTHTLTFSYSPYKNVKAPITFTVSGGMDMLIKPTKAGLSNAFTLYEGSKVIGASKLIKIK